MQIKVVHLTSVHTRYDTRIFEKECKSLSQIYSVTLVVADGKGDEVKDGVKIVDVGKSKNKLQRILKTTQSVFKQALLENALIYHIHDPELMYAGLKLHKIGKKVIFDAHEDVPKQILGKVYLSRISKWLLSNLVAIYEKVFSSKFDYVITSTPSIERKFISYGAKTQVVANYPILDKNLKIVPWEERNNKICCTGAYISKIRCAKEMLYSVELSKHDIELHLTGKINKGEKDLEELFDNNKIKSNLILLGWISQTQIFQTIRTSKIGFAVEAPLPNHFEALPIKIFDYMSMGVPIIASNFPLWTEIVEGNRCGVCVNPMIPEEIAKAIDYIISNPEEAQKMSKNGQKAVLEKYNWAIEEKQLKNIYNKLIK